MDTKRIEELLRTRPPRERTYDRQLPTLIETTRPLKVTVRLLGGPTVGWSTRALILPLVLAIVAGAAAFGVWHYYQPAVVATPTPSFKPGAFSVTGSMTTARLGATATLLSDGRVLVAGGLLPATGVLASAELYDPKTGTFAATGWMTTTRWRQTATLLADGRVLVVGGTDKDAKDLTSAEIYDPASGTFSATGSMGVARSGQMATLLPDGRVLIAGGEADYNNPVPLATAELYDPGTGKFGPTGSMSAGRTGATASLLADGRVLIAGGDGSMVGYAYQALKSAELYDPSVAQFSPTGSLTVARSGSTATLLPDGRVLVAGGVGSQGALSSAELYDPNSGIFRPTGSMAIPRQNPTAVRLNNGRVLILGGGELTATAELYDPATGAFASTGSMTTARGNFTATLLADGRVLIAGGGGFVAANPVNLASAELYQP